MRPEGPSQRRLGRTPAGYPKQPLATRMAVGRIRCFAPPWDNRQGHLAPVPQRHRYELARTCRQPQQTLLRDPRLSSALTRHGASCGGSSPTSLRRRAVCGTTHEATPAGLAPHPRFRGRRHLRIPLAPTLAAASLRAQPRLKWQRRQRSPTPTR